MIEALQVLYSIFQPALWPAVAALVLMLLLAWCLPRGLGDRYGGAVALAAGFTLGYLWIPSGPPLVPEQYWHWLLYLGLAAAVVGPATLVSGMSLGERWLLQLLVAVAAAWFLVPQWESLTPSRPVLIWLLAGYVWLLALLLGPLATRTPAPWFLASLAGVACVGAAALGAEVSLMFGQLMAVAAGSLAACCLAASFHRSAQTIACGLALPFALLVGGGHGAFHLYPEPPLRSLLLIPAAPLALWLATIGPLAKLSGWQAAAVRVGLVLVPVVAALVLLMSGQSSDEW